ncbi:MAG: glycosyltransferase [Bacilli bacterium]|nr:glycosyltransferase [Bacilli bacterium]
MVQVLILTATAGSGHNAAAKSLDTHYKNNYKDVESLVVDIFKPDHRIIAFVINELHFFLLKIFPSLMRLSYRLNDKKKINYKMNVAKTTGLRAKRRIQRIIKEFKPDAIVSTHPFALGLVSYFKEKETIDCRTYYVITDYCLLPDSENAYNMDKVFTSCKEINGDLIKKGVSRKLLLSTGIPVDDRYENYKEELIDYDKIDVNPDLFTILLMNGGQGIGYNYEIIKELGELKKEIQIISINGSNKKTKNNIDRYLRKNPDLKIKVINKGYSDNVFQYMQVSDLYIGKAGGISTTECIKIGLPILIPKKPPFHEIYNVDFLVKKGYAIYSKSIKNLKKDIEKFLKDKKTLEKIKNAQLNFEYHDSAKKICNYIYKNSAD